MDVLLSPNTTPQLLRNPEPASCQEQYNIPNEKALSARGISKRKYLSNAAALVLLVLVCHVTLVLLTVWRHGALKVIPEGVCVCT